MFLPYRGHGPNEELEPLFLDDTGKREYDRSAPRWGAGGTFWAETLRVNSVEHHGYPVALDEAGRAQVLRQVRADGDDPPGGAVDLHVMGQLADGGEQVGRVGSKAEGAYLCGGVAQRGSVAAGHERQPASLDIPQDSKCPYALAVDDVRGHSHECLPARPPPAPRIPAGGAIRQETISHSLAGRAILFGGR